jgi:Ubiquitin-2 like Rad60 SUMO-like
MTFEALRLRHLRSPTPAQQSGNDSETDREVSAGPDASLEHDVTDKFKVVLRAHGMKEITLSVRPTTTCSKIVRAFLAVAAKQGGKAPASPRKAAQVRLSIDGEKQHPDTPISNCDLEDGDLIEVVGL